MSALLEPFPAPARREGPLPALPARRAARARHAAAVEPVRFGIAPDFSLGIEEEALLVDPLDYRLLPAAASLCSAIRPASGRLAKEIFAAQIELITPICADVGEAVSVLSRLRASIRATGATLIGAGLHPSAPLGEVVLSRGRRYREVGAALGGILRTPTSALHVHVGMRDPQTAIRVANGMRRHVPLLHALAANSPFWHGTDSGLASARAAILRSYPRSELPRPFRDWEDFCTTAAELASAAGVPNYTYFWWEVRPHPRLGTVEIRAVDAQGGSARTAALAALIHSLARMEAEWEVPTLSREALAESTYQATRHGLSARLLDDRGATVRASTLARQRLLQVKPFARELGADGALEEIRRILREGNGADRQRAAYARGGLPAVLAQLVEEAQTLTP
jgi:carboxylate-amine ligase